MVDINIFNYLTTWSLFISYSVFIWSFFIKVPKYIFLFAASLLTTVSVLGTFFLTLPSLDRHSYNYKINRNEIVLYDSVMHTIPLIIFLLFFNKFKLRGNEDFIKSLILWVLLLFIYQYYTDWNENYEYDTVLNFILGSSVFISSYYVYSILLKN